MPRQTTAPSISITQTDLFHLAVGFGATFLILGLSCGACTLCILRRRRRRRGRGTRSREGPGTSDTDPDTDTDAGLPSLQLWWPPLSSFTHASPDADKEVYWEGPELWEVEVGVGAQDDMEYRDETVWVEVRLTDEQSFID